jgi:hypothetical protein
MLILKNTIIVMFLYVCFVPLNIAYGNEILSGQQVQVPDSVIDALKRNADAFETVSLIWKQSRYSDMNFKDLCRKTGNLYDVGFLEPENHVFLWQNSHFYQYKTKRNILQGGYTTLPKAWEVPNLKDLLLESVQEGAFDGTCYFAGGGEIASNTNTPGLAIIPLEKVKKLTNPTLVFQDYTTKFGIKFSNSGKEIGTRQESYVLFLTKEGSISNTEEKMVDGEKVFLIEIKSQSIMDWNNKQRIFQFKLLPKYNYVVKQCIIKSTEGELCYRIENDDFLKVPDKEAYIPQKITAEYHTFYSSDSISPDKLFYDVYSLAKISTSKINKDQFDLRKKYIQPGTHIADHILEDTPNGLQYIIPANPADLDRVIEAALSGKDFTPTPLPSTAAIVIKWLLCIAGIAMILYAGYKKFIKKT